VILGVRVYSLPNEALLRVFSPDVSEAVETRGQEINGLISLNVKSGDNSEDAYTWWGPLVEAEEAVLEIVLPAGISPETVKIALPRISHIFTSTAADYEPKESATTKALSCHRNVVCEAGWDNESKAVAHITYTKSGASYQCTGTLLSDTVKSLTPYFLTAYHCINTQTVASSLKTRWFWRTTSCNGSTIDSKDTGYIENPATLLYTSSLTSGTDTAFMRLNNAPPAGVYFAGWASSAPSTSSTAIGIHHPAGDNRTAVPQKVAKGSVTQLNAPVSGVTTQNILVTWSSGATEGGSSGSGLFNSSHQFIGQLSGGDTPTGCGAGYRDYYGRFDLAYNAALYRYLSNTISCTSVGTTLSANTTLTSGRCLRSANGRYNFVMQSDGNAVVYDGAQAIWATYAGGANRRLVFQSDGNLVVYAGNQIVWQTTTGGQAGVRLIMQDDGNLVVYTSANKAVWATGTWRKD